MEESVKVTGLRKAYGRTVAVDGIDVSVAPGEIFGLLGPNGSGKTTTIECALGTRKRDAGSVSLLGLDPRGDRRELFQKVGVQFQETVFQERIRVDELCALTASLYARPADWRGLLDRLGLGARRRVMTGDLSGGERQRLAIVLALVPDPLLLFLDELTTGLDPKARRSVWAFVKELARGGATIFLSSHYMDEVEFLCDRVAILKEGRIAAQGSPSELTRRNGTGSLEEAFLRCLDRDAAEEVAV